MIGSHVTYPDLFPASCIAKAAQIVREGSSVVKKSELGLCLWNVQGYLQRVVLGVPDGYDEVYRGASSEVGESVAALTPGGECDAMATLEVACSGAIDQLGPSEPHDAMHASAAASDKASIDPATIVLIATIVKELIALWRSRRT